MVRRRARGERWQPPRAQEHNQMVEAAEIHNRRGQVHTAPKTGSQLRTQTTVLKIKNASGSDLPKGSVLEVGSPTIDAPELTDEHLRFLGDTPTGTRTIAITKRPQPAGETNEGQVSGSVLARVDVQDPDHLFANVTPGSHNLTSATTGAIPIIWQPGETGVQTCLVLLGGGGGVAVCDRVRFKIVSADPTTYTAIGEILSIPAGCSTIPGARLGGTVIDLCDPNQCHIDRPNELLTGAMGFASYMTSLVGPGGCGSLIESGTAPQGPPDLELGSGSPGSNTTGSATLFHTRWEIDDLCCPVRDCASFPT